MRPFLITLALLLSPLAALPQAIRTNTTTVSINVTDYPDGQVWANGSYATFLVLNAGSSTATSSPGPSGSLDSSGNASFVLTSENDITFPTGGSWQVTVCPAMGCSIGSSAPVKLSFVAAITSVVGPTLSENIIPPSFRIPIYTLRPLNAYRDSEVQSAVLGSEYFNVTSSALRYCALLPCSVNWTTIGSGGGGGSNSFSALTAETNSHSGSFVSVGNTWDFSAAAALKAPVASAALPTSPGAFAYDSSTNQWKFGQNGSTVAFGLASTPCASLNFVSTPATGTSQAICSQPSFSGITGTVNLATQSSGLLPHANIATTAVAPGSYTNADITVAADGSLTAAASGSGSNASQINGSPFAGTSGDFVSFGAGNIPADSGVPVNSLAPAPAIQAVLTSQNLCGYNQGTGAWNLCKLAPFSPQTPAADTLDNSSLTSEQFFATNPSLPANAITTGTEFTINAAFDYTGTGTPQTGTLRVRLCGVGLPTPSACVILFQSTAVAPGVNTRSNWIPVHILGTTTPGSSVAIVATGGNGQATTIWGNDVKGTGIVTGVHTSAQLFIVYSIQYAAATSTDTLQLTGVWANAGPLN